MNIKNVVSVERAAYGSVNVRAVRGSVFLDAPDAVWDKLHIKIPAKLEFTEKNEENQRIYTARLTFSTFDELDSHDARYAYRVKCADGTVYIIGNSERPYAVTIKTQTLPDSFTGSPLPSYTVDYSNCVPVPKI